jgi:phosphopantothenate synthetase
MQFLLVLEEASSFWPTTIGGWTNLISVVAAAIAAVIGLVVTIVKLVKNKNWEKLKEIADAAMVKAEASGKAGKEKLQIALDAIQAGAKEAGITISDSLLEAIKQYIEAAINQHNTLNAVNDATKESSK